MKLTYRRGQESSDLEEGGEEGRRSAWEASPGRLGGAGNIVCVRCTDRLAFSNSAVHSQLTHSAVWMVYFNKLCLL